MTFGILFRCLFIGFFFGLLFIFLVGFWNQLVNFHSTMMKVFKKLLKSKFIEML
jgi:hypothetical protein